jgi:hypothetical protein
LVFPQLRDILGLADAADTHWRTQQTPSEWQDVVEMYARCELTKAKDKLISIFGIAHRLHAKTIRAWCTGNWLEMLCQGLF